MESNMKLMEQAKRVVKVDAELEFDVMIDTSDGTVTRNVTVTDSSIDIGFLMRLIRDGEFGVTNFEECHGEIFFQEKERQFLVATWITVDDEQFNVPPVTFRVRQPDAIGSVEISGDDLDNVTFEVVPQED
jgi:hypothetical protein